MPQNFFDLLGERMQSPMFQMGAGLFSSASNGEDIGTGLLAGSRAASAATKQQQEMMGYRKKQEQDQRQQEMWARLSEGGRPPEWAKALPPGMLDMALSMGPEQGSQLVTQMMLKNADRDLDIRRLDQDQAYKKESLALERAKFASGNDFGKAGTVVQDKDGKFYSVQYGRDGSTRVNPLAIGDQSLSPSRGVEVVGDQMYDKSTGNQVRGVGQNIAEGERQKIVGREAGEGQMALPKIQRSMQQYEIKSANVDKFIDEAVTQAGSLGSTGFTGAMTRAIPGTPAYNLARKIDPIIANLGFDELQSMRDNSPTGGALGSIAVQELSMLQSTLGSLDTAQSGEQLIQHLSRLKNIKTQFRELKHQAYEQDVARFGASAVPNPGTWQPETPAQPQSKSMMDLGDGFSAEFQ
jgi:hypothetical protein